MEALDRIAALRLLPVVELGDPAQALPLAETLAEAGLPCVEITLRTEAGLEGIGRIAAARADVLVGAGTVLTVEQAARAVDAGARFLVSPGLSAGVARAARERGVLTLPGVCTPTEVTAALALGLDTLKFFPAEAAGGTAYLRALGGPFAGVRFVPTGGVTPANLGAYLALANVVACGGSWIAARALLDAGDWDEVSRRAREAVRLAREGRP